jgi:serine/threonine protein phosphatase 1
MARHAPIFAIGDVHGCAPELHRLLAELPLTKDATLVFLGDMVDRGNYTREVIETILDLEKKYKVVALLGNHEDMMLEFLAQSTSAEAGAFIMNGGSSTLASYADDFGNYTIPAEHMDFFYNLRLYYETDRFFFVHAGVPEKPLSELNPVKDRPVFLWTRGPFLKSNYNWGKIIVHGHTPVSDAEVRSNRVNVDTGCFFDGRLTAIEVNSGTLFSVAKGQRNEARIFLRDKTSSRAATRFAGTITVGIQNGAREWIFQTENYSEFGLLIREMKSTSSPLLKVYQRVKGRVGNDEHRKIFFEGEVVRVEDREQEFLYGIKIERVTPSDEVTS